MGLNTKDPQKILKPIIYKTNKKQKRADKFDSLNYYISFIDFTTLLANQRGPLCANGLSSEKSVKCNLFSEINKKAIFLYRLIANRSNYCFLYRGVDRSGYLKTSASEPVFIL